MTYSGDKILVVEDEKDWREMLAERLADEGYAVEVADSYSAALERLRRKEIRLAIVDLRLANPQDPANLDGLDVLRETLMWGSAAIVLTGLGPRATARQTIYREYGVAEIVEKGERFELETFVKETVAKAWRTERPEFRGLAEGEALTAEEMRRRIEQDLGPVSQYVLPGVESIGEQLRELRVLAAQIRYAKELLPDAQARLQELNERIAELEDRYLEEGPLGLA
jgi:DNA-binding response OmpR family regulator